MFFWHKYALTPLFQSKIALRNLQGEVFTWQQLCSLINRQSLLFQQHGVKAGSGVLLCGKNDFSLLLAYLATIQLGARVLGVNPKVFLPIKFSISQNVINVILFLIGLLSCLKICKI